MILAGDIGGTKTRLALFEDRRIILEQKFSSRDFSSLSQIVQLFLSSTSTSVKKGCFGVAGPVENRLCKATNLPWIVDADALEKELNFSDVQLINDLEAHAHGLSCLQEHEFYVLNSGKKGILRNAALIAAGTGLGEAGLYWDGKKHHPFSCEGGHVDFAPRDELEIELFRYLQKQFAHVSYERVLSGPGLLSMYRFLVDEGHEKGQGLPSDTSPENAPLYITKKALNKEDPACVRALDWFISIYGSEAGNLALKFLALGGVFVGGGIAPKILKAMQSPLFMEGFTAKGRFSGLLSQIPVKVVLNENTALLGANEYLKDKGK
ncbi:MAG: glucokinase [Anaerolineae bacterium]